jgi:predicted transcriptional regulator
MAKDTRLSFRVRSDLKKKLETIAATESRSVAQVCEAFLSAGTEMYKDEGSKFLQRFLAKARPGRKGAL